MTKSIYEFIGTKLRPIELAGLVKKILCINRKFFLINDNYWYLDPVSNFGIRLLRDGYYEPEMTALILDKLDVGDVFIDLGGNEGYFSILASKKIGNSGIVFCIEPQNRLLEIISGNINKNYCYNINIIPFAISDKKDEVSITLSPSINTGSSTIVKDSRRVFWKRQKLKCTTLDEVFLTNKISIIKLMKIDIEGFEFFAIKGAENILRNKIIKNIIIEFHPIQLNKLGQNVKQIYDFLKGYGYEEVNGVFTCEK